MSFIMTMHQLLVRKISSTETASAFYLEFRPCSLRLCTVSSCENEDEERRYFSDEVFLKSSYNERALIFYKMYHV